MTLKNISEHIFQAQALSSIGGRNLKNIVSNICRKIFTNEIAILYSLSGRKKPKLSLEKTNFARVIISKCSISTFIIMTSVGYATDVFQISTIFL